MKKVLALIMALLMVLSLAACGGSSSGEKQGETQEKVFKIGDTAEGKIFNFTVNSVEYIDKIKDGLKTDYTYSDDPKKFISTKTSDLTADNGYSIVKIDYSFDYNGKTKGDLLFNIAIDYDSGYVFDECKDHFDECKKTVILPSGTNLFGSYIELNENESGKTATYNVNDPISYKGDKGVKYIVVDNEVKNNSEKPLVLKVSASISSGDNDTESNNSPTENETFIFNIR